MHVGQEPMTRLFAVLMFSFSVLPLPGYDEAPCTAPSFLCATSPPALLPSPSPSPPPLPPLPPPYPSPARSAFPSLLLPSVCGRRPPVRVSPDRARVCGVVCDRKRQRVASAAAVLPPASCAPPSATSFPLLFHALFHSLSPFSSEIPIRFSPLYPYLPPFAVTP